ncbi:MAG TPA: hypothetical protein VMM93_02380, partial [Vicinamibacterales bacterium]|nr:hypothetical protein [Vicinamibacterales bacterium]
DNPPGIDGSSPGGRDDLGAPNEPHLPVDRPVVVQLSSKDVIHSFGSHAMRVKQDAIPGLLAPVWFTLTVEGRFDIACSQLCGLGHCSSSSLVPAAGPLPHLQLRLPRQKRRSAANRLSGKLIAPDGRTPLVRSVWFIERGEDVPRLVTAFPAPQD